MRYWCHAIFSFVFLFGASPAEVGEIGWQEAVARLAAERTRAETCVRLLKQHGDEAAVSRGELTYGEAKAEFDGAIAGLIVALAEDDEPPSLPDLEARLERGHGGLKVFCGQVEPLVPDASGEKGILDTIIAGPLGPLIEAVKEIYLDYRTEVREERKKVREVNRLTRITIQNQLEATKWPAFADVSVSG